MLSELEPINVPAWLEAVDSLSINLTSFPLKEILTDSLYYPSSGFDGNPIKFLNGNIISFVYADYGLTEQELNDDLTAFGIKGYEIAARRNLSEMDLAPNGWPSLHPHLEDGNPLKYADKMKRPFAEWIVFQRKTDFPEEHGPRKFSLVFICADGVATYQALYVAQCIVPMAVAIIQPGTAFGHNWTNFTKPEHIFGRTVLQNPAGKPAYLLYAEGDRSPKPCWPEYGELVKMLWTRYKLIGVWKQLVTNTINTELDKSK